MDFRINCSLYMFFSELKLQQKTSCGEIKWSRIIVLFIHKNTPPRQMFNNLLAVVAHHFEVNDSPKNTSNHSSFIHNQENRFSFAKTTTQPLLLYSFCRFVGGDSVTMTHLIPPKKCFFSKKTYTNQKPRLPTPGPSNTPR